MSIQDGAFLMESVTEWDEEFDVVSVGSGAGGVVAALTAASEGASALVIEKYHQLGGVTSLSAGQVWMGPTTHAREAGFEDSPEEVRSYLDHLSAGFGDLDNRQTYIDRGAEALDSLTALGLRMQIIPGLTDYYYPDAPGSKEDGRYLEAVPFPATRLGEWQHRTVAGAGVSTGALGSSTLSNLDLLECGADQQMLAQRAAMRAAKSERAQGAGLMANLIAVALEQGVQFRAETAAVKLVGKDRVEGVIVTTPEGSRSIRARQGVVLATSSYDWDPVFRETFEHIKDLHSVTLPTVTGDHFRLASDFRAATATTLPAGNPTHVSINIPGEMWGGRPMYRHMIPALPHSVVVNRAGARFGDESFFHSYAAALYTFDGDKQEFPNWPAWLVFDESFRTKYPLGPIAAGVELPEGMAVQASSLRELAEVCGIDPDGLEQTAERIGEFAITGIDEDFGRGSRGFVRKILGDPAIKPNPNIGPVDRAPFYAIKLERTGTGLASAGLKTNTQAQVMDIDGNPIKGLFAVGNSVARLEFGAGYNSGQAVGRSLVFGYVAGQTLAASGLSLDAESA
ncbi:FAD-binding protein [Leifsonia kafniensis]|uniref:FAD-binding protein n=1 Tax=Leifsonia kafniensis TaxID=475957 RepID=A0ABP7KS58_9MICO